MTKKARPLMLRVVLDTATRPEDANAISTAIQQLRGVKHVETIADFDRGASVEQLKLTTRPQHALLGAKILTIGELTARSRLELRRVKGLGKRGLDEIVKHLAAAGLQLRPQTGGEFAFARRRADQHNNELRDEFLEEFDHVSLALRRLWMTAAQKGYVNGDWHNWKIVDAGLRAYARRAAKETGVELDYDDILSSDPQPLVLPAEPAVNA